MFEPVIGLEVHVQLKTATKMFCGCRNAFGGAPNSDVCPVCLGLPGALPVVNRRAVELAVRVGLALGGEIHPVSVFARKNYFYPDLPKGYQITQYDRPLATGGHVEVGRGDGRVRVGITRVHLEEDAGKSLHHGFPDSDRATYLDFNRAGVPLIEIVTEPDLRSAEDAAACFAHLRALAVAVGASDGNMDEGSLRCDANVSVRPRGTAAFGTKTEVKNINSFRYVEKALAFEIARQQAVLAAGGRVRQETRLWDTDRGETVAMRGKEEAHDYRYFPEPDLPPLAIERVWVDGIAAALPELPAARQARLVRAFGLNDYDADVLVRLVAGAADYFEAAVAAGAPAKAAANWIQGDVRRRLKDAGAEDMRHVPVTPAAMAALLRLIEQGTISATAGKAVFDEMWTTGRPADAIVAERGLAQLDDETALAAIVGAVVAAHPESVAAIRAGRNNVFGFLVGLVMKETGGRANPRVVNALLDRAINGG